MKNRLSQETSPYLKQHENNPVDWYPWGDEALNQARAQDKPILLSVGYSACHWCHVMAHECFENVEIAKLMNENFINIKVDREERPDLDQIYQAVAQMMTKSGGWPLTVFLTPELKPFYGGTYFPPSDRYGRPGFPKVILSLAKSYREQKADILVRADKMTEVIRAQDDLSYGYELQAHPDEVPLTARGILIQALSSLLTHVDWQNGGVGGAPKFPNVMSITFLWRMSQMEWVPQDFKMKAKEATLLTLEKMAKGGIFDQLGGGFHRYSVDEHWAIPHFEKMLYDQGLLLKIYGEVVVGLTPIDAEKYKPLFIETIQKTVHYLHRNMEASDGLFYAAEDADSEGEEGKFFAWTKDELKSVLNEAEMSVFSLYYGIGENGNFENGSYVLFQDQGRTEVAALLQKDESEVSGLLESARAKAFAYREKRVRPGLDDKKLVAWNGLLVSGLSWASLALSGGDADLAKQMALAAYEAIRKLHINGDSRIVLKGMETQGVTIAASKKSTITGFLDDYSFFIASLLDLTRVNPERSEEFSSLATHLSRVTLQWFQSDSPQEFYFTPHDHEPLIHRPKSVYDQAIPAGSAVMASLVSVFHEMGAEGFEAQDWTKIQNHLSKQAFGMSEFLNAYLLHEVGAVTIKGVPAQEFLRSPFCFVESTGKETVQFCHDFSCKIGEFNLMDLYQ